MHRKRKNIDRKIEKKCKIKRRGPGEGRGGEGYLDE
jgi:hypothetical protein